VIGAGTSTAIFSNAHRDGVELLQQRPYASEHQVGVRYLHWRAVTSVLTQEQTSGSALAVSLKGQYGRIWTRPIATLATL
jgi:hypothetical protein